MSDLKCEVCGCPLEEEPNGAEMLFHGDAQTARLMVVRLCEQCYQEWKRVEPLLTDMSHQFRRESN